MVDYDLHIHSSYSDGVFTPREIFNIAKEKGLKGISLTDHDTVRGLEECKNLSFEYSMDFIPGIELGTYEGNHEIHILGYYIDYNDKEFLEYLNEFQEARFKRAEKMINMIRNLGYKISLEDVLAVTGSKNKAIGRPHIARAMVSKGYFNSTIEVFERLIGNDKPAYVERFKLPVKEGIELINRVNGVPVLAHPALIKGMDRGENFKIYLEKLISFGLMGIEVYHSKQSESDSVYYQSMANRYNLIVTGGSDCHGINEKNGYLLGERGISEIYINKMKNLKGILE